VPPLFVVGAIRLARPGSPWARWRYRERPGKLAKADHREQRLRRPVINVKIRIQDLLAGKHTQPGIAGEHQLPPGPGAAPRAVPALGVTPRQPPAAEQAPRAERDQRGP
jgi:lysyl-tRNA synthetase class 2